MIVSCTYVVGFRICGNEWPLLTSVLEFATEHSSKKLISFCLMQEKQQTNCLCLMHRAKQCSVRTC
jgi:hypothetical protein